ncbi:MAG: FKBP-type peptidyl-prolyl cis-trans isomerase [Candidatus Saccharibacteria bacterium]
MNIKPVIKSTAPKPTQITTIKKSNVTAKTSLRLPIWLMVAPTGGIFLSILIYAIVNFIMAASSSDQANTTNVLTMMVNILLFLVGTLSVLAFVPCMIIGIVILSKRLSVKSADDPGRTLGIVGLVLSFLAPIAGLIISIIGYKKSKAVNIKNTIAIVGIWISSGVTALILLFVIVGTIGSFLIMGLSQTNQKIDDTALQRQYDEYLTQQNEAAKINSSGSEGFGGYVAQAFNASASKLSVEVLKQGNGKAVSATDSINCSYFGWLPDGTIFDSSKKVGQNDAPITFPLSGVITGWSEGLTGVRVGSIVRMTIPSDKGYGAQGSGVIPANSPIQFIVEVHAIDNN